jgi:hypothetical protein
MKLTRLDIISVGLGLSIVVLAYGYFHHFAPNSTEASYYQEYISKLQEESAKLPLANRRVKTAQKMVEDITSQWQQIVLKKTPPASVEKGGIQLTKNRWQLTVDARKFRDSLQEALNEQLKKGGVTVIQGPQIPFPPATASQIIETYFNYPATPFPVAIFDLGTIIIRGKLEQIAKHILEWNNFPNYMAVTEGLKLRGTSPNIIATYNLAIVAYIRGENVAPQVPEDVGLTRPLPATPPRPGTTRRGGSR